MLVLREYFLFLKQDQLLVVCPHGGQDILSILHKYDSTVPKISKCPYFLDFVSILTYSVPSQNIQDYVPITDVTG